MDGDLVADFVLHNGVTGVTQVFTMDGLKVDSPDKVINDKDGGSITVSLPWRIAGTNDFDRDGNADILWHNGSTGETQIWFMEGKNIRDRAPVDAARDGGGALVGLPWSIVNQ